MADSILNTLCRDFRDTLPPGDTEAYAAVERIEELTTGPIRLGLVGRVSSGKSTLVNAIVGRQVAATAAQDCTRLVTTYRYGSPEQVALITTTGTRVPLPLSHITDPEAIANALPAGERAERLEVALQSALLADVTLVDTPGVQGTGVDAGPIVRRALADIDVLILLFRGAIRADDTELVEEFQQVSAGASPWAEAAVGLLSHADNFGSGAGSVGDPIDAARDSAAAVQRQLSGRFSTVLAVAPLLAEAARTGAVTEADVRVLRSLATVDPAVRPFLGTVDLPGVDTEGVRRVAARIGPYALNRGIDHAGSAGELLSWLDQRSGVLDAMNHVRTAVVPLAWHARAERCVRELTALAADPRRAAARAVLERATLAPEMHGVRELLAYRMIVRDLPNHALRRDLEALLRAPSRDARIRVLGQLAGTAPDPQLALARARTYQGLAGMARRGAEAEAARVLARSMVNIAESMGWSG